MSDWYYLNRLNANGMREWNCFSWLQKNGKSKGYPDLCHRVTDKQLASLISGGIRRRFRGLSRIHPQRAIELTAWVLVIENRARLSPLSRSDDWLEASVGGSLLVSSCIRGKFRDLNGSHLRRTLELTWGTLAIKSRAAAWMVSMSDRCLNVQIQGRIGNEERLLRTQTRKVSPLASSSWSWFSW